MKVLLVSVPRADLLEPLAVFLGLGSAKLVFDSPIYEDPSDRLVFSRFPEQGNPFWGELGGYDLLFGVNEGGKTRVVFQGDRSGVAKPDVHVEPDLVAAVP